VKLNRKDCKMIYDDFTDEELNAWIKEILGE
jgi:hypothetical protein